MRRQHPTPAAWTKRYKKFENLAFENYVVWMFHFQKHIDGVFFTTDQIEANRLRAFATSRRNTEKLIVVASSHYIPLLSLLVKAAG